MYKGETKNSTLPQWAIAAPIYQQIIDWLREKHNIHVEIFFEGLNQYSFDLINNLGETKVFSKEKEYYEAMNRAIEEAFKYI